MLGVIAGDVIGSRFEWHPIKTIDFPLFHPLCSFTDDTVLTVATAWAILHGTAHAYYNRIADDIGHSGATEAARDFSRRSSDSSDVRCRPPAVVKSDRSRAAMWR